MQKQPKLFGFKDSCEYLGVSNAHLYRLIGQYKLPSVSVARGRLYLEEDLNELKQAHKEKREPNFSSFSDSLRIYGYRAAAEFVGVSESRFIVLLKNYDIPFQQTSCGKIFFEEDLRAFMKSEKRLEKMKHGKRKT